MAGEHARALAFHSASGTPSCSGSSPNVIFGLRHAHAPPASSGRPRLILPLPPGPRTGPEEWVEAEAALTDGAMAAAGGGPSHSSPPTTCTVTTLPEACA